MAKELKALEQAKAKQRHDANGGDKKSDAYKKSDTPTLAEPISDKGETRDKLAEMIGVSHGTYDKMVAIDESGDEKLIEEVRSGDVSINHRYYTDGTKRRNWHRVETEKAKM